MGISGEMPTNPAVRVASPTPARRDVALDSQAVLWRQQGQDTHHPGPLFPELNLAQVQ